MRTKTMGILAVAGGVIALIAFVALIAILSFDINSYKSMIESAVSDSTGLHVKINGKVGLSLFPFGVSAKNVHVSGRDGEILSLEHLKLGAELLPLLKKKLKVTSCVLVRPAISVVKDLDGKYNFESGEKSPTKGLPGTAFTLNNLKLSEGSFVSVDKGTGEKTELKDISLAIRDLAVADTSGEILKNVSFTGSVDCKQILRKDLKVENFKASVRALKGRYSFEPLTIDSILHSDTKTGEKTELKDISLAIRDLAVADTSGEILKNVSFTGSVDCKQILRKDLKVENFKASVRALKGRYSFEPLTIDSILHSDTKTGEKTELKDISLAIRDLAVADTSGEILKNVSFTGSVDCKQILRKDLKVENFKASVRALKGRYSFEPLTIDSILHSDTKTGEKTELKDISLAIRDLAVADTSGEILKNVSFTGSVDCKQILRKDLKVDSVRSSIKARKGVFHFKPFTMYILGGKGEGDFAADISKIDATYGINLRIPKLDFEKLEESFGVRKVIGGKVDLIASLTVRKKGGRMFLKGVYGTLSLRGKNLVMYTVDLDKVLSAYEASQKFSLLDIGAFFITGPLGSVALRGYRYGDLYYQTQGGLGSIRQFVSRWKIRNGEAEAMDCALATRHNRVALRGKLNLVEERYDNLVVALLDDKGCAKFKQSISGSFSSPQVGAIDVVESFAAPLLNLFRETRRFVQGRKCQVFYNGSVRPPR